MGLCFSPQNPTQAHSRLPINQEYPLDRTSHAIPLTPSMASDAVNLTTTKTLNTTVPASTKPYDVQDSTSTKSFTVDSGSGGTTKNADDARIGKATAVNTLSPDAAPVSDTDKKIRRAERFGVTVQLSEEEKRNSRADRFGTGSTSQVSDASKKSEEVKRKARAERFGLPVPPVGTNEEVKKKARLERFAPATKMDTVEEDKRKARAIRFSQAPSNSVSMNGNGNCEPKAVIAGKAAGGS